MKKINITHKTVMKLVMIFIFAGLTNFNILAQVGINTVNPIGLFNIDAFGDNSANPTDIELNDDVIIKLDSASGVLLGIGGLPHKSAQLDLGAKNKALRLNRVALQDARDLITVQEPKTGMIVYNTTRNSFLQPGLYTFTGITWVRFLTRIPQTDLNFQNLQNPITSIPLEVQDVANGTPLDLGTLDDDDVYRIHIDESGSYAFTFRLYGSTPKVTSTNVGTYHLALLKNDVIQDFAELHVKLGGIVNTGTTEVFTYSVTLGCEAMAGDGITFRLSHNPSANYPWTLRSSDSPTLAARTTMIFWKL